MSKSSEKKSKGCRIGVLSDTHGYLDPAVADVFEGVDLIIHAGDIGGADIISALEKVAPVTAVHGNLDGSKLSEELPAEATGSIGNVDFVVGHKRKKLMKRFHAGKLETKSGPPGLVIFGHDHQPAVAWIETTLFMNPGSASSPYEEDDTPTVAIVESRGDCKSVRFIPIPCRKKGAQD